MNRRDMIASAFGISVCALLPAPDDEYTDEEMAAMERIYDKVKSGEVEGLYKTHINGAGKDTISLSIEWTDPDVLLLRRHGIMG